MNTPRQVSRLAGALIVACLVAVVGCSTSEPASEPLTTIGLGSNLEGEPVSGTPDNSAEGSADIDTVMMVGDSITVGATSSLEEQFDALGLDHVIESAKGKRMAVSVSGNPSGAVVAASMVDNDERAPSREIWVVALGTNDIGQYSSPDEMAAAVNEVLAEVPDEAALVWVDTYVEAYPELSAELNAIITERVARRGNSVIAPWSANAPADGVLSGDGVHPGTEGSVWFAFVVTDTVRAFLGR